MREAIIFCQIQYFEADFLWKVSIQSLYGNGKTEFQDFSMIIFLNFFPILYKTARKMHFLELETLK